MAWKAPGQWKTPLTRQSNDDSSFPGLKPSGPEAAAKIEYEELQQNELLALEAIYGEDFIRHSATNSAWQVRFSSFRMLPPQLCGVADGIENGTVLRCTNQSLLR
jgi:translation initiation factor 2-alpha kinase 4